MSYIDEKYTLEVRAKYESGWIDIDAYYVRSKLEALAYELKKTIGDKFDIDFKSE